MINHPIRVRVAEITQQALQSAVVIDDPEQQAKALCAVAVMLAGNGQAAQSADVAGRALQSAARIKEKWSRAETLGRVAAALAGAGQAGVALRAVARIGAPWPRAQTLSWVAAALAEGGHAGQAADVAGQARQLVARIGAPWPRAQTLSWVAAALAEGGHAGQAADAAGQALQLVARIDDSWEHLQTLSRVAAALAVAGQTERAVQVAARIDDPWQQAETLSWVATVLARAGQAGQAAGVAGQALQLVARIDDSWQHLQTLSRVAAALAVTGQARQALQVAAGIAEPWQQAEALSGVAAVLARAGQVRQAQAAAGRIEYPRQQARALTDVAAVLARAGQAERAAAVAAQAQAAAGRIEHPEEQARALSSVAAVLARAGQAERAAAVAAQAQAAAGRIRYPRQQARALTDVAAVLARAGQAERAAAVAAQAQAAAGHIEHPEEQARALSSVAVALARAGQAEQALQAVARIEDPEQQARALSSVSAVLAGSDREAAETAAAVVTEVPGFIDDKIDVSGGVTYYNNQRYAARGLPTVEQEAERRPGAEHEIVDRESGFAPEPQPDRLLVGEIPSRIRAGKELSLIVSITAEQPGSGQTAVVIPGLSPGKEGTQVTLIARPDAGLVTLGDQQQTVVVPQKGDSPQVRFAFLAQTVGLARVRVSAWLGGTFLAELQLEVSIESVEPATGRQRYSAPVAALRADTGEVTLQVRSDGTRYSFQLLSQRYLFSPVMAESLTEEPGQAVERTVAMLRRIAGGQSGYTPKLAARWIRETGIGLWQDLVPKAIQDQFWDLRDSMTSFNIACEDDRVPWELLYPLSPADDEGFLVEQFPVLRRVYGQCRSDRIFLGEAQYVVPPGSPQNAQDEVAAIGRILRQPVKSAITDLADLLDALDSGSIGLLHFACHNTFSPEAGGSAIKMADGAFVPRLLNSAVGSRCLAGRSPLIFINACRSTGVSPEYTHMMGWASQFMAAGAGAFVGTLWPVRSSQASVFAETFYNALAAGENLGRASMIARDATKEDGDPTWLAYAAYGDPAALALRGSEH